MMSFVVGAGAWAGMAQAGGLAIRYVKRCVTEAD